MILRSIYVTMMLSFQIVVIMLDIRDNVNCLISLLDWLSSIHFATPAISLNDQYNQINCISA